MGYNSSGSDSIFVKILSLGILYRYPQLFLVILTFIFSNLGILYRYFCPFGSHYSILCSYLVIMVCILSLVCICGGVLLDGGVFWNSPSLKVVAHAPPDPKICCSTGFAPHSTLWADTLQHRRTDRKVIRIQSRRR